MNETTEVPTGRRHLTIGPIGSRGAMLNVEWIAGGILVETGCFKGTIEAFQKQVLDVHGYDRFGLEYAQALEFIEQWGKLEL